MWRKWLELEPDAGRAPGAQVFSGSISPNDVQQGQLGNCCECPRRHPDIIDKY